jgi:hypothetical protein
VGICSICGFSLCSYICLNSPEGVEKLCSDVGVDHTDVRILMLAWYVVICVHVIKSILHSDLYLTFIINFFVLTYQKNLFVFI